MIDETLPARLVEAIRDKNLLIVCGAGISVAPPSSLPSWWGFNNALFEGLRSEAIKVLPGQAREIEALQLQGRLPVSAFSDLVVSTFAGEGYFPLLTALDGARPNANHLALAELASQGIVADIITFNFDTLIEQAFRTKGVPLRVLVRPADYDLSENWSAATRLHKVHGSVTDAATLIDTVTQKLKGLAIARRERLGDFFRTRHVLFLGFSGADFDFGSDYLPMAANAEGGLGFTWLHRGSAPPPVAGRFANSAGVFVGGDLPAFLGRLGVAIDEMAAEQSMRQDPAAVLAARVKEWVRSPAVGSWASAAFLQAFARRQQDKELVDMLDSALNAALSAALEEGAIDLQMGGVMRVLALHALAQGEVGASLAWSARELEFHEMISHHIARDGAPPPRPGVRLEYLRNTASIYSNIALATLVQGGPDGKERAKAAWLEANGRAREARDQGLLALIQFNLATYVLTGVDAQLQALRTARHAAKAAGNGRTMIEAGFRECEILIDVSELDLAVSVIDNIEQLLPVAGMPREVDELALRRAYVAARRDDFEGAMRACEVIGRDATLAKESGVALRGRLRQLFSSRPELFDRLAVLLARLGDMDPIVPGGAPRIALQSTDNEQEDLIRSHIALAEQSRNLRQLTKLFERLAGEQYRRGAYERLADTAFALELAAERAGTADSLRVSQQYLGIAREMLGDLDGATASFTRELELCELAGRSAGHVRANLAGLLWRQGREADARDLYTKAREELLVARDWEQLAVARVNFARNLFRSGHAEEAEALLLETAALPGVKTKAGLAERLEMTARQWGAAAGRRHDAEKNSGAASDPDGGPSTTAAELGDRAIGEIEAGQFDVAREHIAMAMQRYLDAGDLRGQARCEGNLAQLHARMEAWDDAIAAQRRSVALRDWEADGSELLLAESNLAIYLLSGGKVEEAIEMADNAMRRAPRGSASWPYALASRVVVIGNLRLGRLADARAALPVAIGAISAQRRPEREPMLAEMNAARVELEQLLRQPSPRTEIGPVVAAIVRDSKTERDGHRAARDLEEAANDACCTIIERATLLGEAANRLVAAGMVEDSLRLYEVSARTFAHARHPMAWHARGVLAKVLSAHGQVERAQLALNEILAGSTVSRIRCNALTTLAGLVLTHYADDETRLAELLAALLAEWWQPCEDEASGRMGLMLCQLQERLGDIPAAKATLARAKAKLIACNSEVLPKVENLEAALAEAEMSAARDA